MVKNAIIGIICMILLVTAGSFAYVGYHNTKVHIRTENEKHKAEAPNEDAKPATMREKKMESEKKKKEKERQRQEHAGSGKQETDADEDVAYLVSGMYVTPFANGDIAYRFEENETEEGVFVRPYVVEHRGRSATLHFAAGYRGSEVLEFDRILVKGEQGGKELVFPQGTMQQGENDEVLLSWYDLPASNEIEDVMRMLAVSANANITIVGHEQETKSLSPVEIQRFNRMLKLYDALKK